MKKILCLFGLMIIIEQASAMHEIDYRISPLGNLVYQLDCMAAVSRFSCSKPDFDELWHQEIKADAEDDAFLDRWYQLRSQLNEKIEFKKLPIDQMITSPNYPVNANSSLNVLEQIRIIAFATGTRDQYREQLELLLSPNHVDQELQILNHFWSRFEPWFTSKKTELQRFVGEARALSEQIDVNGLLSAMRKFYRAELPVDLTLPVYLVAHPKAKANSSGLAFKQNSIIEVLNEEKAADRLSVVIHEIAHFYHEQASFEHHVDVMKHFTHANSKTGIVGYYLFNEALASAIGNGIVEQRLRPENSWQRYFDYPMSFYADQGIDMAGKAAMEVVKPLIASNQAMDQNFLTALDHVWATQLKDIKTTPKQRLRHVGLINITSGDGMGEDLLNQIFGLIQPSSAHVNDSLDIESESFVLNRYPRLDVLILANTWEQLIPLNLAIDSATQQQPKGLKILTSPSGAKRIIVVADQADYIVAQVTELLSQQTF